MRADTRVASEAGPPTGLADDHLQSFLKHLDAAGYAQETVRKKRSVAISLERWIRSRQLELTELDDSLIDAFVRQRSARRTKAQISFDMSALRSLLKYLRAEAGLPTPSLPPESSTTGVLRRRYVDYLRSERGLAENSIRVYEPYVRDFLGEVAAVSGSVSPADLAPETVQQYLLDQVRGRSCQYSRLLAAALRSFLHFLFLRGETTLDLSPSIPMVRTWRQASVPAYVSPEEIERVLSSTDLSTRSGRRDHAILLLLARLGLRAGEVVALELGDIRWRTGQIIVRGKGRVRERLPLLSDVGEALAGYLRSDRGTSASRRVFLRTWAPRTGLTGPAAIGHVVRKALAKAAVRAPKRVAAHLFRHSLATQMIRRGASLAEISEVLRHRCRNSTAIYAKVAFESLRGVARPWPDAEVGDE